MNIRSKFLIPLFILVGILALHINFVWSPKLYNYIKTEDAEHLRAHLKTVADSLVPLILENQLAAVYENLDIMLESNSDWKAMVLYDEKNNIIYPLDAKADFKARGEFEILITQPVKFLDHALGKLAVIIDVEHDYLNVQSFQNEMLRIFLIGLFVFIVAMVMLLRYVIHKPIYQLSEASDNLAKGNFNSVLPHHGKDEVGKLVSSFSSMQQAIEAYQLKLKEEISNHVLDK